MAFKFAHIQAMHTCLSNNFLRSKAKLDTPFFICGFVLACSITHHGKCPCMGELSAITLMMREWSMQTIHNIGRYLLAFFLVVLEGYSRYTEGQKSLCWPTKRLNLLTIIPLHTLCTLVKFLPSHTKAMAIVYMQT